MAIAVNGAYWTRTRSIADGRGVCAEYQYQPSLAHTLFSLNVPIGGCSLPLGVISLSATLEACFRGELMSILPSPLTAVAPLAGDERKKRGEEEATVCRGPRGVD